MSAHAPGMVRAVALVGATGVGKTTLMEAMLGGGAGPADSATAAGSATATAPEARARGHSVELNVAGFDHLGDRYRADRLPGGR